jgi:hypothetical protein
MAATQRVYERRSEPGELDADRFAFCTVRRRAGPLSMVLGRWKVGITDEAIPTGAERPVQSDLIRCIFGNPFRPITLAPTWLTSTVVGLASAIYADRAFDRLPILADALEEAGCNEPAVLAHCRSDGPHARGCWVVDLLLGKE